MQDIRIETDGLNYNYRIPDESIHWAHVKSEHCGGATYPGNLQRLQTSSESILTFHMIHRHIKLIPSWDI